MDDTDKEIRENVRERTEQGIDVSQAAAVDAVEWLDKVAKNFDKVEHRKSATTKLAFHTGVAINLQSNIFAELVPTMLNDFTDDLGAAKAMYLVQLFVAKYIENLVEGIKEYEAQ